MLYIKEPATHMHICGNNEGLSLKYSLTCIYLKLANVLRVRAPNCPAKSFTVNDAFLTYVETVLGRLINRHLQERSSKYIIK